MRLWIDLANSPQVPFFVPLIREFDRQGHQVTITTRNFAQTVQLASDYGLRHTVIGEHGGKSWGGGLKANLSRAWRLTRWVKKQAQIDLAVSHNSYSQGVAAKLMRLPFVTLMDYEHQPLNHLCFRLARRVIVPDAFPQDSLRRFGAVKQTIRYPGLKEQLYLADFRPLETFLQDNNIPKDKIIVVVRPPAPWAVYSHFENPIFSSVLQYVASHPNVLIVFLPRIQTQVEEIRKLALKNVLVPPRALNGANLVYHADLVISAGGTMNREAALLGTPTYTIFAGRSGAVDQYLIDRGRMTQVSSESDLPRIRIEKRPNTAPFEGDRSLVEFVTNAIIGGAA